MNWDKISDTKVNIFQFNKLATPESTQFYLLI